ncbi:hypothetical protein PR048_015552 [Dryococelus australis]|uniref:Reverse transcriptase Ty1/copia-type domain-containing protein n=1 Tax=Dryococelus australis TaxID=614101 RepID=A0ABQ9HH95_9NEOP|nr:hypothetical protein PR048_015552 [Dryococelus australis]
MSEKKKQMKKQKTIKPERTMCIQKPKTKTKWKYLREDKKRQKNKPKWLEEYETSFISLNSEPLTYEEAINSNDKRNWEIAMKKELDTLEENNTWVEVTKVPEGADIIYKTEGKQLHKAHLMARGFEKNECNLSEVYSPVAKLATFRIFMVISNNKNRPVHQMDVVGAFLHGDITEVVYLELLGND